MLRHAGDISRQLSVHTRRGFTHVPVSAGSAVMLSGSHSGTTERQEADREHTGVSPQALNIHNGESVRNHITVWADSKGHSAPGVAT